MTKDRPMRAGGAVRGSLSRSRILEESLRLLDDGGTSGLSMPKLGRALGVDQTAVYRHFASKDDLLLALADLLLAQGLAALTLGECWVENLRQIARSLRQTYLTHPAAASVSSYRTTQQPAEMRSVDIIVGETLKAGFTGAAAALTYRMFADFILAWCGKEAAFLALDPALQQRDRKAWRRSYSPSEAHDYPNSWAIRTELADVGDDAVFDAVVDLVLDGIVARAPQPCGCPDHRAG